MSKQQWSHGFHMGLEQGIDIGEQIGNMQAGEYAWHSINAAIEALQQGEDLRALMLLRTLRFVLAPLTGRDLPDIEFKHIKSLDEVAQKAGHPSA